MENGREVLVDRVSPRVAMLSEIMPGVFGDRGLCEGLFEGPPVSHLRGSARTWVVDPG